MSEHSAPSRNIVQGAGIRATHPNRRSWRDGFDRILKSDNWHGAE